jgi:hypothetical protein
VADPVPKPPAFDGKTSAEAWTQGVLKPDGTPYSAFGKFPSWKTWVDKLRDHVEALRVGVFGPDGIKEDLDRHTDRLNRINDRVTALEEKPSVPFPGSG